MGNWPAAQIEFEAGVRLRPDSTLARLDLVAVLASQGRLDAAQREFEQVLQLEPGNQQAQELLNQIRLWRTSGSRVDSK